MQPRLSILNEDGENLQDYYLPENSYLNVDDGVEVKAGQILAKMLKESQKTQDITGGLPRVGELFEARHPGMQPYWPKSAVRLNLRYQQGETDYFRCRSVWQ